jgi:hypothetical protein
MILKIETAIAPAVTVAPTSTNIECSGTATLTASATGSLPLRYQWYNPSSVAITSGTNSTLILTNLHQAGAYSVVVANAAGTASAAATVNISDTTSPGITCNANMSLVIPATATGTNVTFSVNATDACDGILTAVSTPASGSFFAPGTTTVHSYAVDSSGNSNSCSFQISVDRAPVAANTTSGTTQNQSLVIPIVKLLDQCTDADGDTLTILSAGSGSVHGVATLGDDAITYVPATDYIGSDSFSYEISDNRGGTAFGTVTVTVTPASAPSLNIVSPPTSVNGHFQVGFAGIPGVSYTIQYSTNATGPWTTLTNMTAPDDGLFEFVDPSPATDPSGFYRTTWP